MVRKKDSNNTVVESSISQLSTPPNGSRTIIIIGELKGKIDIQKASIPSGLFTITYIIAIDSIKGIVIGRTI